MLGTEPGNQANVEYFFRLLYEWFFGPHAVVDLSWMKALFAHAWLWIVVAGYALAVLALFMIVYTTVRLFELRKREAAFYGTLIIPPEQAGANPRWEHIESLLGGAAPSEWKEAIMEADIMLDDILARKGYVGDGVGEKLKAVTKEDLASLNDAWEAHKVRNQTAHEGSAFKLSESLARRTLQRYAAVFREFDEI